MSVPPSVPPGVVPGESSPDGGRPQGVAAAISEVSERATLLIREEIELAKAEIAEKSARMARGAAIGAAAGVFLVTALLFFLVGCAWLLYFELPIGNQFTYFWGFFAMAVILVVLGVIAGLVAARALRSSAPPTPDMAIEEARKIRETVAAGAHEGGSVGAASTSVTVPGAAVPPIPPPPPVPPAPPSTPSS